MLIHYVHKVKDTIDKIFYNFLTYFDYEPNVGTLTFCSDEFYLKIFNEKGGSNDPSFERPFIFLCGSINCYIGFFPSEFKTLEQKMILKIIKKFFTFTHQEMFLCVISD